MKNILEHAWSIFAMVMMLIGIGGLAFNLFKNDGWGSHLLGRVFDAQMAHPAIAIPTTLAAIWLAWACLSGKLVVGKQQNLLGDLLVFAMVFTGIWFTYQWLTSTL
ncbi:MAG TPA: hypothetical protein VI279_15550 [Rhodocyclaceae bacterium]